MAKYIFITGGVSSSLGKGITAASLGRLLKARGYSVTIQKFDPYLNVDPGTMNPYQHGEVFVTEDGMETDLDLGHYERFIDENLTRYSSVTSGQIYYAVLTRERNGEYNGDTVQIIPHLTDEIKDKLYKAAEGHDVVITEIGGTIGDIEGQLFIEAIREFQWEAKREDILFIHVTLIPYLKTSQELKTKPTQHSVRQLQSQGIQPDLLVCRSDYPISWEMRKKLAQFCNVKAENIIPNLNADTLYEVPLMLENEGFADKVCTMLGLEVREPDLADWYEVVERFRNPVSEVTIALVGKYIELHDAYLSVAEALRHGGIANCTKVNIRWLQADDLSNPDADLDEIFAGVDGILVPGGFGSRGIEGKLLAAQYAREHDIPYFGICLGMQIAVIEFMRHVCGLPEADSTEFDPDTPDPVIDIMEDQKGKIQTGGTMRLGHYSCALKPGSKARELYGKDIVEERHRHRYEFNNSYLETMEAHGMIATGWNNERCLFEIVELKDHPWFIGCQFHPEFKSRPNRPHPLFAGFISAALNHKYADNPHACELCAYAVSGGICTHYNGNPDEHFCDELGCIDWYPRNT